MKKCLTLVLSAAMLLSMSGCTNNTNNANKEGGSSIKDGTYTTTATGNNGEVKVETTFSEGKIISVEVSEHSETAGVADNALTRIPQSIVEKNAVNIDTVTGATNTSNAILDAVKLAIEEAGGKVEDFQSESNSETGEVIQLTTDIVVIGAGAAGVSSALSAAQNGAEVILLEKASTPGGVSIIAGGMMGIDSQDQKDAGVAGTFTTEEVLADWQSYNCWMSDAMLFYNIMDESGKTIDWLEQNGMEFTFMGNAQASHEEGFQTYHIYEDQENKIGYYYTLIDRLEEAGGQVYYETPAYEIMSENNKITGVKAKQADGTILEIKADAVILCTGGFGANADVIQEEVGFPLETFTTGTQTGDGAAMSQAIGAGKGKTIQQYHGVTSYSGIQTGSGQDQIAKAIYMPTSVWVNQRGSRFAPEDLNYDTALASNAAATQGEYYYSIISEAMVDQLEEKGSIAYGVDTPVAYEPTVPLFAVNEGWTGFKAALDEGVNNQIVYKADTIEELAAAMNVDAATLKQTMEQYNQSCMDKNDEVLGKDAKYLVSMNEGPYYAVKARPVSLGGIGGVLVNSNLQVIKEDGTVIQGLYAAGNEIGEIYNNSYPLVEGVTLMTALAGGKLCGEEAAQYVNQK